MTSCLITIPEVDEDMRCFKSYERLLKILASQGLQAVEDNFFFV
ncbi:hypothetical protein QG37_03942 [Candidozyma auris]|uniref:Uncharacterized protein n=1 Tax=Candidozyma auris TaxID=498019 RepID=A0A0L0NY80_CANAR|nr:hypothetical protein QG37_03942 [[Candida] auris]